MKFFFSCDWGTSAFRLRLIQIPGLEIVAEINTPDGIASKFDQWTMRTNHKAERLAFFRDYLLEQLGQLTANREADLSKLPVIVSGMASSTIGMMELPYKQIPFAAGGADLVIHEICQHPAIILISGVSAASDVARGEETMLAGCEIESDEAPCLLIFPGTHSKHILVKNGIAVGLTTYMTGELFDLLANKSILSKSVEKSAKPHTDSFTAGVLEGARGDLSNSIFHVRTNQLFNKRSGTENYQYLSGLLIGHELRSVKETAPAKIILVCGDALKESYTTALSVLRGNWQLTCEQADAALIRGQYKLMRQHTPGFTD